MDSIEGRRDSSKRTRIEIALQRGKTALKSSALKAPKP